MMANLVRAQDWSNTLLGPVESWPQSLITSVNMVLETKFPMMMFWGSEFTMIYNDSYIPIRKNTQQ